jgi:hypothetical protein
MWTVRKTRSKFSMNPASHRQPGFQQSLQGGARLQPCRQTFQFVIPTEDFSPSGGTCGLSAVKAGPSTPRPPAATDAADKQERGRCAQDDKVWTEAADENIWRIARSGGLNNATRGQPPRVADETHSARLSTYRVASFAQPRAMASNTRVLRRGALVSVRTRRNALRPCGPS